MKSIVYFSLKIEKVKAQEQIVPPQTVAIEVEPSEAMTSEFIRTAYGNSLSGGNTASKAFSARVPTKKKNI